MKLNYWFLAGLLAAIMLLSMIDFRTESFTDTTYLVLDGHPIGEPNVTVSFGEVIFFTFAPFTENATDKLDRLKLIADDVMIQLQKITTPVSSLSFETDIKPLISSRLSAALITAPPEAYNQIWDTLVAWNPAMPARVRPDAPAVPTIPDPLTTPIPPPPGPSVSPLPLPGFPSNTLEIKSTQPGTHL